MVFYALPHLQMNQELPVALRPNKMLQVAVIKGPQTHKNEKKKSLSLVLRKAWMYNRSRKMAFLSETRQHTGRSQVLLGSWTSPEILLGRLS